MPAASASSSSEPAAVRPAGWRAASSPSPMAPNATSDPVIAHTPASSRGTIVVRNPTRGQQCDRCRHRARWRRTPSTAPTTATQPGRTRPRPATLAPSPSSTQRTACERSSSPLTVSAKPSTNNTSASQPWPASTPATSTSAAAGRRPWPPAQHDGDRRPPRRRTGRRSTTIVSLSTAAASARPATAWATTNDGRSQRAADRSPDRRVARATEQQEHHPRHKRPRPVDRLPRRQQDVGDGCQCLGDRRHGTQRQQQCDREHDRRHPDRRRPDRQVATLAESERARRRRTRPLRARSAGPTGARSSNRPVA